MMLYSNYIVTSWCIIMYSVKCNLKWLLNLLKYRRSYLLLSPLFLFLWLHDYVFCFLLFSHTIFIKRLDFFSFSFSFFGLIRIWFSFLATPAHKSGRLPPPTTKGGGSQATYWAATPFILFFYYSIF